MKKGTVIATLILLVALAGAGAVYQFYVKELLAKFQEHQVQEAKLTAKIKDMKETFSGTRPELVLATWRGETQPWVDAVARRSRFFNLGEIPLNVLVPEERIPKFYWREEYPKREEKLRLDAWDSSCTLGNVGFGLNSTVEGRNPSREQVSEWLTTFEFGAAMTRLLIRANVASIDEVNLWEPRPGKGNMEIRTTGLSFTVPSMKELATFLESLRHRDRYFSVEALSVSNRTLRDPYSPLQVDMILSQAIYLGRDKGGGGAVAGGPPGPGLGPGNAQQRFSSFFATRGGSPQTKERSWWQNFRKKWLPF